MKIEFTSLKSEPLVYFLLHSGVFVVVLGTVFFLLGIWFGAAIWARYKVQTRLLEAEIKSQLDDIATLKRKLAEQSLRPATGGLISPPAALLTEVLPRVSEIFPERLRQMTAQLPAEAETERQMVEESLMPLPEIGTAEEDEANAGIPYSLDSQPVSPRSLPSFVRPRLRPLLAVPAPLVEEVQEVEPFSFLMIEDDLTDLPEISESLPQRMSALSAIISAPMVESPVISPPTVIPEMDSDLGMIFRVSPPETDDLTRIQGVSPAIQKRLHELGVFRLQQIAGWQQTQVREFSRRLAFKDRIAKERWQEQARRLMEDG